MDGIGSVNAPGTPAAGAVQAAQANTAAGTAQTQASLGLPPVNLAGAASANTIDAELVASQWGIDPATVGGVYGGAGASGGLFAGDSLLPLLADLTRANAEQALALIGVKTPVQGGSSGSSAATSAGSSTESRPAATPAAPSSSGPMLVDPLWGRST